jgi:N-sulfoglucosamine sulfohydrolase
MGTAPKINNYNEMKIRLLIGLGLFLFIAESITANAGNIGKKVNILLITADDLNYNSVGAFGCSVPETTPNIDKLASRGLMFTNAHVNTAVCQPSRGVIMTGMYGHTSGVEGFEYYEGNQPTLTQYLKNAGYLTGMIGKVRHSVAKYETELKDFDLVKYGLTHDNKLGFGRDPQKYYESAKSFFFNGQKRRQTIFFDGKFT